MNKGIRTFRVERCKTVTEAYVVDARSPEQAEQLVEDMSAEGFPPDEIVEETVEYVDVFESEEETEDVN